MVIYIYICVYIYMYIYICMYICMYICIYIQIDIWIGIDTDIDIWRYIYIYTDNNTGIYFENQISRLQLGVWEGGGGGGDGCIKPLPILLYITIWLYILIYTILLYILFFKTINFPKFNFLASYSSSFLKSNLAIFWA